MRGSAVIFRCPVQLRGPLSMLGLGPGMRLLLKKGSLPLKCTNLRFCLPLPLSTGLFRALRPPSVVGAPDKDREGTCGDLALSRLQVWLAYALGAPACPSSGGEGLAVVPAPGLRVRRALGRPGSGVGCGEKAREGRKEAKRCGREAAVAMEGAASLPADRERSPRTPGAGPWPPAPARPAAPPCSAVRLGYRSGEWPLSRRPVYQHDNSKLVRLRGIQRLSRQTCAA
nr:uncharacterized protein LOC109026783 [Gorilla gorilla gorilla]